MKLPGSTIRARSTGTAGKRPLNRNEPKPVQAIPTCPAHLSPTAKAEWKRLAAQLHILGILTQLDRAALAAYCQSYGRWVEAERKLQETAPLIKTPSGYVRNPPVRLSITHICMIVLAAVHAFIKLAVIPCVAPIRGGRCHGRGRKRVA